MATQWSEVVNTTIAKYLKGASDLTIRDRYILRELKRRKRLTFGWSGTETRSRWGR